MNTLATRKHYGPLALTPTTMLSAIPLAAVMIGANERVSALNPMGERVFGAHLVGRHFATVFRQPALLTAIEKARVSGVAQVGQQIVSGAARDRVFEAHITPYPETGEIVIVFQDITERAEAGEMRSEFVANVSHELRTPLTAISGFIETLKGPAKDDPEAQKTFLDIMENEAHRMHRLVNDLLSLAKVEDLERVRPSDIIDVSALMSSALKSLTHLVEESGVRVETQGLDVAHEIPGDPDQMVQVFTNLLENSIKYGGSGGVVRVSITEVDKDVRLKGPGVIVVVEDEGEGIDQRHLARLTERFYRVDTHRSRGKGGTGLGLAIVKHIVNRHRGWLRIESELGEGSRFSIGLPKTT